MSVTDFKKPEAYRNTHASEVRDYYDVNNLAQQVEEIDLGSDLTDSDESSTEQLKCVVL